MFFRLAPGKERVGKRRKKKGAISRRLDKQREKERSGTWYKYEAMDW